MTPAIERVMADLLAEIEIGDQAAREGHLTAEQRRWVDEAKAQYRRLGGLASDQGAA